MRANPLTWAVIRILTMRGKRHLKELRHNCARADDLSRELLLKIVRDNRDTEYGRAHHFSEIKSIEDYKRLVPLSTYDDYAPYIERMVSGKHEKNLITAYPIVQYAETSGSVGVPKKIPVTKQAMEIYTKYTITRVTALADEWHRKKYGKPFPWAAASISWRSWTAPWTTGRPSEISPAPRPSPTGCSSPIT